MYTCPQCGKEFTSKWKKKFCTLECRDESLRKRVAKVCDFCGKNYEVQPCLSEVTKYCSRNCQITCYAEKNKKGRFLSCKNCGKDFWRMPSKGIVDFCGRKCQLESIEKKRVTITCNTCEKVFTVPPCNSHYKYCSTKCGGIGRSTNDINYYRRKSKRMNGERCYMCIHETAVDVHHIDADRNNNSVENLVCLCRGCHKRIHHLLKPFLQG